MPKLLLKWTRKPDWDVWSGGGYDYDKDAQLRAAGRLPVHEGAGFDECWIPRLCWVNQFGDEDWFEAGEEPPGSWDVCDAAYAELMGSKGETQH